MKVLRDRGNVKLFDHDQEPGPSFERLICCHIRDREDGIDNNSVFKSSNGDEDEEVEICDEIISLNCDDD